MITEKIRNFSQSFVQKIKNKKVYLISHFDTDGITAAAIFSKTLERLNIQFSVKILKQLTKEEIKKIPKNETIILLDLGSSHLKELSELNNEMFVIDHHEIKSPSPNINIINPHLEKPYENLCSAELAYLISTSISTKNNDLSKLAIIGMVGDTMEREINKTRNQIINNANVKIKKGVLLYPSTRPLDRTLEYCSRPFIPGVTGDSKGTYELLNEAGISKIGKKYKALIDLNEKEMKHLVTAITLRLKGIEKSTNYFGNLYLVKLFNKIEDARELSAMINACSRMGNPEVALMLCLGNKKARKKAERIYVKYRQNIISGLKYIDKNKKIQGNQYVIINAKDKIKDTLIGTMASILSFSSVYKEGTVIITMAYNKDKIKVSTRISGRTPSRNLKKLMDYATESLGGESGGHKMAAGCNIHKKHENKFIELIKRKLDLEVVKV